MIRSLAHGHPVVMATAALTVDLAVVHTDYQSPVIGNMAGLATFTCSDMTGRL